jgi:hypothetical protein
MYSGALPPGVSLLNEGGYGFLDGTPTAAGTSSFTVQVSNSSDVGTVTGTQAYTLTIFPAGPAITTAILPPGIVGVDYSLTLAASGGFGAGTYKFSVSSGALPGGITLSSGGTLSGTPTAIDGSWLNFGFTVQVTSTDAVGDVLTGTWTPVMWIYATPQTIAPTSLPNGVLGAAYPAQTITSSGGNAGNLGYIYTFSLSSGTLPPGITLSTASSPGSGGTGTLSGTPTASGTFNFTLQVTSGGDGVPTLTGTQAYAVTIYTPLAVNPGSASSGTVGVGYSQAFTAAGAGGASTYTWSVTSGALPPGLTLSAAGVLSGTPTASSSYAITVQVSSVVPGVGVFTASQVFTVTIYSDPPLTISGSLGGGTVGVPYSTALGAAGGYGPSTYTFSIVSGALPSGITLTAGGTLLGTPAAVATSTFTVQVASAATGLPSLTATESFTVTVYPSLAIALATASSGTVSVAYSQTFTATGGGGASTYTWSLSGGTLPPGVTFSSAGVLSGTPTTSGTFPFTLQVSSLVPTVGVQTASQAFSVAIAAVGSLAITGAPAGGTVGVAYSGTLGATGGYGTGTYTFSIASGALPSGITLSAGGTLSGTPAAVGTSTFTAQVTSGLSR